MARISRSIDLRNAENLVSAVGTLEFGAVLARFMRERVGSDHVTCLTYDDVAGLVCLLNDGDVRDRWAQGLMRIYVEKYFRLDPNLEKLVTPLSRASHSVVPFDPNRLPSTQYRTLFWRRSPFADKCSLIFFDEEIGFYCNLYRSSGNPPFTVAERAEVNAIGKFVAGLLRAHLRIVQATSPRPRLRRKISAKPPAEGGLGQLSSREKIVMNLILVGQSNEAIALDQGVSLNTVKTYRKRLYRKLNVSTSNELHARFGKTNSSQAPVLGTGAAGSRSGLKRAGLSEEPAAWRR